MSISRRNIYHILSFVKLIIGLAVLLVVYHYIDPFQDPQTGVIIGSIGLLFLIWGASYFAFYFAGLRWSDHKVQLISSYAYKLSLLVALFFLTNIVFLVVEFWSVTNSMIILIIFGSLYWIIFHRPLPQQHASIDFLVTKSSSRNITQAHTTDLIDNDDQ